MIILSLETASNILSVALLKDGQILIHHDEYMERGQGEALIPLIESLFKKVQIDISQLNAVAVGIGPGSFTGVRIGLAAARGIGMSLDIPVYGVTGFEAFSLETDCPVIVVLDTKRGDYYTQLFNKSMQPMSVPVIQTAEQLKKYLPFCAAGEAAQKLSMEIGCSVLPMPDSLAVQVAKVALMRLDNPLPPEPLYLREADVTV